MYKAFVVLKEAKEEAKRKRVTLEKFFKNTETCLYTKMNDKLRTPWRQISSHKQSLERKEYVILIAGW